ncbi:MAG: TerY-C metal binding domain-containing protein [Pseudomonadota bacterium]
MRRLPIFFLLDVSESMVGDNLRQLQQGLERLITSLRTDPHALETVYLSVIAFAGKARTLAPLTELAVFYPPRLPIGSGTSLGSALDHLMDEIKRSVTKSTSERKGDWKPVVYLMTDGKPTDDISDALARWKRDFASSVTLVAIGIGRQASLDALHHITDHVLQLDATSDEDFRRFVDWVTMSVVAQSRSVSTASTGVNLAKLDDSILTKISNIEQASTVDEDFVILTGRCQNNRLPYLIKYERAWQKLESTAFSMRVDQYNLAGVYALEADYFDLSDTRGLARSVNSDTLIGAPGCPHCGNPIGFAMCACGQIMCIRGTGEATCPTCKKECNFGYGDDEGFDVTRARG